MRRSGGSGTHVTEVILSGNIVVKVVVTRDRGLEMFAPPRFNITDLPHGDRCRYLTIRADVVRRARDICGRHLLCW
jgi:hypothetical protein